MTYVAGSRSISQNCEGADDSARHRSRSLSSSPQSGNSRNRLPPLNNVPRKLPQRASNLDLHRNTNNNNRLQPIRRNPGSDIGQGQESPTITSNSLQFNGDSSRLSSTYSEESLQNSGASSKKLLLKGRGNRTQKYSARSNRSHRSTGRTSQRFPNHVLVSARSLESQSSELHDSHSSQISSPSRRSRSLPQPKSLSMSS